MAYDQITMPDCPVYPPHVPGTMLQARTQGLRSCCHFFSRAPMLRTRAQDLRDQKNDTGLLRLRSSATMDQPAIAEVLE